MEASSPLAALHRPMPAPTWGGRDIFRSHYASVSTVGPFSLREQMHRNTADYFSVKEVRGSSPAGCLAADLSQNFRIDNEASPKFPTPRRALFTASMMGSGRAFVTTPPLPESSPAPLTEIMEMSPLPHKAPFSSLVDFASPTPTSTAAEDIMMLDSPAPIISRQSSLESVRSRSRQSSLEPAKPFVADRRIAAPRRSSAGRMKSFTGASTSSTQLPSFQFGGNNSTLSLDECFESNSPPQERSRPTSANSPCPAVPLGLRSRPQFAGIGGNSRHGSPSNFHARRQSNPFLRTRKQFRRSLSMFEHPADVMKPKPEGQLAAAPVLKPVADVEEAHEPTLPHFLTDDPTDTIPRITKETMLSILDGKYCDKFDQRMVIDCRFEYEYDGGHIDGAVNHNDKELLANQLFQTPMSGTSLLIFHCEYSAHRAPLMARHIRSQDRTINAEHYPRLTYPEVYILDGGYSGFFAEHRSRCYPPEYVEMSDDRHQRTCEREMGRLKARKGLGRAQTFAFGQRETCLMDSPTGPPRPTSRNPAPLHTIIDSPLYNDRSQTRRMASY